MFRGGQVWEDNNPPIDLCQRSWSFNPACVLQRRRTTMTTMMMRRWMGKTRLVLTTWSKAILKLV